jgi:hypothetical protein
LRDIQKLLWKEIELQAKKNSTIITVDSSAQQAAPFSSAQQAEPLILNSNAPVVIQDFFLESCL